MFNWMLKLFMRKFGAKYALRRCAAIVLLAAGRSKWYRSEWLVWVYLSFQLYILLNSFFKILAEQV